MVTKKVSATKTVSKTAKKGFDRFFSGKSLIILVFSTLLLLIVPLIWYMNKRIFIARVNGQPISRIEFYKELQKSSGETVLNDLITKKLISQEADKRGIKISEADVQNELGKIRSSIESQGSTLEDVLTYQGVTKAQLVENIQIQKKLEGILKEQITVSDTLTLKGFALWKAAKNSNKYWFVAILIINLFGIPELLYIFIFSKRSISFSFLHSQKSNSKK